MKYLLLLFVPLMAMEIPSSNKKEEKAAYFIVTGQKIKKDRVIKVSPPQTPAPSPAPFVAPEEEVFVFELDDTPEQK